MDRTYVQDEYYRCIQSINQVVTALHPSCSTDVFNQSIKLLQHCILSFKVAIVRKGDK